MPEPRPNDNRLVTSENSNRVRDHLANERTFLAWVRTGVAVVVFGFAIGRFAIAIRQFMEIQGQTSRTAGVSVWFGTIAIIAGVLLTLAGLVRYRRTRAQLESGEFEPGGFVVDLVGILVALFGLVLAGYLVYIELRL
ncbi:MAG: YidH family protein [Candidatus Acidiferrales bacterium]